MNIYEFNDYNKYNSLKMSSALWLLIAYSMRHGLLLLGLSISNFSHSIEWMSKFTDETHWAFFVCGIPGFFLLIATSNRVPEAGKVMRWIWHKGRNLLALSLALHLTVSLTLTAMNPNSHLSASQIILFLFDVIGFIYLYRSQRVRDVFADFPSIEPSFS